jgi:methionyl-tRNA formyltransferase
VVTPPPAALRIVFFGTPAFAVPTLDALVGSRYIVAGVVTQPDKARGRGQVVHPAPVKEVATAAALPLFQPSRLKDGAFLQSLAGLEADVGVVAAYGKILPADVLAVPKQGLLNVHGSLLPAFRGAAPVHRAVIAGERQTGVTIMRMVQALDAGPMLASATRPIGPDETSDEVERDLAVIGSELLVATLDRLAAGPLPEIAQDDRLASYAPKLTKEEGLVDWRWPAERIHNLVRGLHPWPHAYTFHGRERLILRRSRWTAQDAASHIPGAIVAASGDRLAVATGSGTLEVTEIQPEGRRAMAVREFLAGRRWAPGDRLGPP